MRRRLAYVLVPLAFLGISGAVISGCAQSAGERCQINDDCEKPLVCNDGTGICQLQGSGTGIAGPDAMDGGPPDATVDATVDAQVDAMPDAN